ncbi:type VII secretion protein [Streptomyces longispororuber]|uniref:type VII secretion protein n=1 Tax=Streptomyces longispororuber TaxID=68230 RepID=UPI0033C9FBA8
MPQASATPGDGRDGAAPEGRRDHAAPPPPPPQTGPQAPHPAAPTPAPGKAPAVSRPPAEAHGPTPPPGRTPAQAPGRAPAQPPSPPPPPTPTLDPRLALALGTPAHGDTALRRTGRTLRKLAGSASRDVDDGARLAQEVQQPVTTGRVVAVTSIRGGVGKTTVSALLGRTFTHYRHDPVLTLEADAALGTLPVRLGAETVRWACGDLARILNPAMRLTDVTGYLVPVSGGGWLLPASQGRVGAPLDVPTYRTVTLALRRYFAVTVVDCETLPGDVARTAMDTAHARVVVAPMTAEGVNGTRLVLDWLGRLPHSALATTVVALTAHSPDMTLHTKSAAAHLRETGVTVVPLAYDRHLAAGGPIRTERLAEATRASVTRLAAEVMRRAVRVR